MRHIRRAKNSDAHAIQNLYIQLNTLSAPSVSPERIGALENTDHAHLLVCEDGDYVIATALVCFCEDVMFQQQPFAVVENVVVDKKYLRGGIGRSLMDYIEDLCLQRNCSKIMLQTSSSNRSARSFYTSIGYDPNGKVGFVKYRRYFQ